MNRLYKKWQRFNEKDAKTFKEIMGVWVKIRQNVMASLVYSPPSVENWDEFVKLFKSIPHVPDDFLEMTGFELLDILFEDEHLKAQLAGWAHACAFEPHVKIMWTYWRHTLDFFFWCAAINRRLAPDTPCSLPLYHPLRR